MVTLSDVISHLKSTTKKKAILAINQFKTNKNQL